MPKVAVALGATVAFEAALRTVAAEPAMIPSALQARAFGGFTDPTQPAALRARYEDEVA